jgi:thioredoxin reductase (NADPH)
MSIVGLPDLGGDEESPDRHGAFPRLDQVELAALAQHGERRVVRRGEVLFVEGEPEPSFDVILVGRVAIVEGYGTPGQQVVGVHGAGRFLGELGLLTGQVSFFTAVMVEDGEVLTVPVPQVRVLVGQDAELSDQICGPAWSAAPRPSGWAPGSASWVSVLARHSSAAGVRGP